MALQEFNDITGSKTWYDPTKKVVYTQGGTNPTQYTSPDEWNARQQQAHPERILGNGNSSYGGQSLSSVSSAGMSAGQPTIDLNSIYETATNSPEIQALQSDITAKQTALNTALAKINDNPFYSEATRVGRVAKLNENANNEITTLSNQLAEKMADAQVKVNIATQQYNIDSQEYQNNLSKLNMLISNGALSGASGNDLAEISVATGISTDMIKSIQENMSKADVSPQLITDNNGNVTIVDANSGKVINTIAGIGKSTTGSVDTTDAKEEAKFYTDVEAGLNRLKNGDNWGAVWNSLKLMYPQISNEVLDTLLDKNAWYNAGAYENYKVGQL